MCQQTHGISVRSSDGPGPRYNEKVIASGAQTSRPGDAGPVRSLLGGLNLTGRFCLSDKSWAWSAGHPFPHFLDGQDFPITDLSD